MNDSHAVSGIITRVDILEHRLEFHTFDEEEQNFFKQVNRDKERKVVYENEDMVIYANASGGNSEHDAKEFAADISKSNKAHTSEPEQPSSGGSNNKKNVDVITVKYKRNTVTEISHEPIFDPSSLLDKQTIKEQPIPSPPDLGATGIVMRTSTVSSQSQSPPGPGLPPPPATTRTATRAAREPKETSGNQW